MKLKTLSTHLVEIIMVVIISISLSSCTHPLIRATPEQLKQQSTGQLADFVYRNGKEADVEVSQELERRQREDIDYLIQNATNLKDFESIRYPHQTETIASKIADKYVPNKFSGSRIDSRLFDDARRKWYIKTHPDISNEIRESILNSESQYHHALNLGMTKEQVIAAIGSPDDINRSTGSWGVDEQWVYGGMIGDRHFPSMYFYFSDGKLTSIQD